MVLLPISKERVREKEIVLSRSMIGFNAFFYYKEQGIRVNFSVVIPKSEYYVQLKIGKEDFSKRFIKEDKSWVVKKDDTISQRSNNDLPFEIQEKIIYYLQNRSLWDK